MNIPKDAPLRARKYLESKYNCSEAAFMALVGEDAPRELMKIATPFGGGFGGFRNTCGIITGCLMAIGYYLGRTNELDKELKKKNYKVAKTFCKWVQEKYSFNCKDIVCDEPFVGHTDDCLTMLEETITFVREIILSNK